MTDPDWLADPSGVHELRYWSGGAWTEHVADGGIQAVDPDWLSRDSAAAKFSGYLTSVELSAGDVVIHRTGLSAKVAGARISIPLASLIGVRFKEATPIINGHLQLLLADNPAPRAGTPSDPHTIVFRRKQQQGVEDLRRQLEKTIARNAEGALADGAKGNVTIVGPAATSGSAAMTQPSQTGAWWQAADAFQALGVRGRFSAAKAGYLGGWRGYAKARPKPDSILRIDKDGVALVLLKPRFTIPWNVIANLEVEGPEQAAQRITATRLLTMGVFALAVKKKSKSAILIVTTVDGEEPTFLVESYTAHELRAKLAVVLSHLARAAREAAPVPAAGSAPPDTPKDPIEQIRELNELRTQGILTDEEFNAKKLELLGRL